MIFNILRIQYGDKFVNRLFNIITYTKQFSSVDGALINCAHASIYKFIGIEDTFTEAMTLLWTKLFLLVVLAYIVNGTTDRKKREDLGCFNIKHEMDLNKDLRINSTTVLKCRDKVQVPICWGRCDTWDIPDYRWSHTVCAVGRKTLKRVKLSECDPTHPDPYMYFFIAESCVCKPCEEESCKYLHT